MNELDKLSDDIEDFLYYILLITGGYVDRVEMYPIHIEGKTYLCGIKQADESTYLHLKEYDLEDVGNNASVLREKPQSSIWVDTDVINTELLIDNESLQSALEEFKNVFYMLNDFIIANISYVLKDTTNINNETVIYEDKKLACKDIIEKRKVCSSIKSKLTSWGDTASSPTKNKDLTSSVKTISDEDFINMPIAEIVGSKAL